MAQGDALGQVIADESRSVLDGYVLLGAKKMPQRALECEVEAFLAEHADRVDEHGRKQVVRNGYLPARTIMTGAGPLEIEQPRVRNKSPHGGGPVARHDPGRRLRELRAHRRAPHVVLQPVRLHRLGSHRRPRAASYRRYARANSIYSESVTSIEFQASCLSLPQAAHVRLIFRDPTRHFVRREHARLGQHCTLSSKPRSQKEHQRAASRGSVGSFRCVGFCVASPDTICFPPEKPDCALSSSGSFSAAEPG